MVDVSAFRNIGSTVERFISNGVLLGLSVAAIILVVAIWKRMHRQTELTELVKSDIEPDDIDSAANMLTGFLTDRAVPLLKLYLESIAVGQHYKLEDQLTPEFYESVCEASHRQEYNNSLSVTDVELIGCDQTKREVTTDGKFQSDDSVEVIIHFNCNMTISLGLGTVVFVNYNTPKSYTASMLFLRKRIIRKTDAYCPRCGAPIFGSTCITCGHTDTEQFGHDFKLASVKL